MVQETDLVTGHGDEWRRRTFRVVAGDSPEAVASPSSTTDKEEISKTEEEARIDEFYENLFDAIPQDDSESSQILQARYESSRYLLNGISLGTVLNHAARRYARAEARLLSGDPQMDFGSQLEETFLWYRNMRLAAFVQAELDSETDSQ